jgi:hypothetical protein
MVMILPVLERGLSQTAFLPKAEFLVELDATFVEGKCIRRDAMQIQLLEAVVD